MHGNNKEGEKKECLVIQTMLFIKCCQMSYGLGCNSIILYTILYNIYMFYYWLSYNSMMMMSEEGENSQHGETTVAIQIKKPEKKRMTWQGQAVRGERAVRRHIGDIFAADRSCENPIILNS